MLCFTLLHERHQGLHALQGHGIVNRGAHAAHAAVEMCIRDRLVEILFSMPVAVSSTCVTMVFMTMLEPSMGLINQLLGLRCV